MRIRASSLFLIAVLLLGQVGGWLHERSHYARPGAQAASVSDAADATQGDGEQRPSFTEQQCLICLVLGALALPVGALIIALMMGLLAQRGNASCPEPAIRWFRQPVRDPPIFS